MQLVRDSFNTVQLSWLNNEGNQSRNERQKIKALFSKIIQIDDCLQTGERANENLQRRYVKRRNALWSHDHSKNSYSYISVNGYSTRQLLERPTPYFFSSITVHAVGVKNGNLLFDSTCLRIRISINEPYFIWKHSMSFGNSICRSVRTSKRKQVTGQLRENASIALFTRCLHVHSETTANR